MSGVMKALAMAFKGCVDRSVANQVGRGGRPLKDHDQGSPRRGSCRRRLRRRFAPGARAWQNARENRSPPAEKTVVRSGRKIPIRGKFQAGTGSPGATGK